MSARIHGRISDDKGSPVENAKVSLHTSKPCTEENQRGFVLTDREGRFEFRNLDGVTHYVCCKVFNIEKDGIMEVPLGPGDEKHVEMKVDLGLKIILNPAKGMEFDRANPCDLAIAGSRLQACVESKAEAEKLIAEYQFLATPDGSVLQSSPEEKDAVLLFTEPGMKLLGVSVYDKNKHHKGQAFVTITREVPVAEADRQLIAGNVGVRLERTRVHPTLDQALWVAIRNRTHAIGFLPYSKFINLVLDVEEREHLGDPRLLRKIKDLGSNLHGVSAYDVLKFATEVFLLTQCGIRIDEHLRFGPNVEVDLKESPRLLDSQSESARVGQPFRLEYFEVKLREYLGPHSQLPYISEVVRTAFPEWRDGSVRCDRVLTRQLNEPCLIELIWSYWHEEGMLAQTMNAVTRRFQNVRAAGDRDPIAHLEIDPLRPLNNLIWGIVQDEIRRLSVKRRAYEYEHEYGLTLYGKAVREVRPADSRSKFLEGFHNLLHLCSIFFKEDNDTTVIADGYPLLNALKEVHLQLAQGAHNQFGDLPWTARAEMMLQQWMLARPEIRDFLQSRAMVPYKEAWMPQVDTMKTLQGWSDVTVTHFRDLAVYGEQILLSVRYGNWIALNDEDSAKNWARYWRPEIQGYLHAYRAATGIDLTNPDTVDSTVPAVLLQKRLALQQQRTR